MALPLYWRRNVAKGGAPFATRSAEYASWQRASSLKRERGVTLPQPDLKHYLNMVNLCGQWFLAGGRIGECLVALIWIFLGLHLRASAQPTDPLRFIPLAQGGYWEYRLIDYSTYADRPAFISIRVAGDTVVAAETYALMVGRFYNDRKEELSLRRCGIRAEDTGGHTVIDFSSGAEGCPLFLTPYHVGDFTRVFADTSVVIAGLSYELEALAILSFHGYGTGGSGGGFVIRYAVDIGMYSYYTYSTFHWGTGGGGAHQLYELVYGEVGGRRYGVSAVSVEAEPGRGPEILRLESVFPNPFRDELHVRLREEARTPMRYELFDVMGRRLSEGAIPPGSTQATIELGPGAAGVYFLQLSDRNGRLETRQVVRTPGSGR